MSTFRCLASAGWDISNSGSSSHWQTASGEALRTASTILSLVGSASAFVTIARRPACAAERSGSTNGSQQPPGWRSRSVMTGNAVATWTSIPNRTVMYEPVVGPVRAALLHDIPGGIHRIPGPTELRRSDIDRFRAFARGGIAVKRMTGVRHLLGAVGQLDGGEQRGLDPRTGRGACAARQGRPRAGTFAGRHARVLVACVLREPVKREARGIDQDLAETGVAQLNLGDAAGVRRRLGARRAGESGGGRGRGQDGG